MPHISILRCGIRFGRTCEGVSAQVGGPLIPIVACGVDGLPGAPHLDSEMWDTALVAPAKVFSRK